MFKHGKNAEVWLGDTDLSGFLNSIELKAETDTAETSTFQNDWKSHIPGMSGATIDFGGLYDPTQDTIMDTLAADAGTPLTVGPAGLQAAGDLARLMTVRSTAYAETSPVGGVVGFKWSVLAEGDVAFGQMLHPLGSEAVAGNGTVVTGPVGGSADGGVAHLHITAITDDLDVTIEDSSNGTDGWVAIATFNTASAVGSEKQTIAGTIRRYVRATFDPNAGTATFGVALARF